MNDPWRDVIGCEKDVCIGIKWALKDFFSLYYGWGVVQL